MRLEPSYSTTICQRLQTHMLLFSHIQKPSRKPIARHLPDALDDPPENPKRFKPAYDIWLESRQIPGQNGSYLIPGAQRRVTYANTRLACSPTVQKCVLEFLGSLWALNPVRTTLMMSLNIIRSLFPAFRGYSQAMIIDELQSSITSGNFTWSRLLRLIATELLRRGFEGLLDSFAASNEQVVSESARFYVEYHQLAQRVRLDVPTLSEPTVRDLLQESDLFARSFNGGGFGLLSPLDFVQILSHIIEIVSHVLLIISLTHGATHLGVLLFSLLSALLPFLIRWCSFPRDEPELLYNGKEAQAAEHHERMRNLAYSDVHRPEISLFGLADWILQSWSNARKVVLASEHAYLLQDSSLITQLNLSDFLFAFQNIPLMLLMQNSSATLGSLTLYRSSIQCVIFACGSLVTTTRMAFQGIFLMTAFCATMTLKPRLQPEEKDIVLYKSQPGGVSIEARGLSYTYPGSSEPALHNINFCLSPGETLAIVGFNGSGKSTLAKVLLRIIDFNEGSLCVNGVDIRRYNPDEYHAHTTAVFQGFSKFNASVTENVGVGSIQRLAEASAIETAIHLAEADGIVESLPHGLQTTLDASGFEPFSYPSMRSPSPSPAYRQHHGLSGGQWQRLAIARAFMRAGQPEVDLLLFDEPTSSLDARAQNQVFDTIDRISRSPSGDRIKSVIFITHRLSTARRADKIAMMENGTITEFGSHQELMARNSSYAALYNASI